MSIENVLLGVDEFSLTLQVNSKMDLTLSGWEERVKTIVKGFANKAKIADVFQAELTEIEGNKPAGYDAGYTIQDQPYLFTVAYHRGRPDMGISVAFHAYAWATYQANYEQLYGEFMNIAVFMKMIQSVDYTTRLSRIDFTIDYFNSDISLKDLYHGLTEDTYAVVDYREQQHIKEKEAYFKDDAPGTIYLGSRKSKSPGFMRIYDKKAEQIDTDGFRREEAMNCDSWIRAEASYKRMDAHKITDVILSEVHSERDLRRLIIAAFLKKYRLRDVHKQEYLPITQCLIDMVHDDDLPNLRVERPQDNDLLKSIRHLRRTSGLYSTMVKVENVYGKDMHLEMLMRLEKDYQYVKPLLETKESIKIWVKTHENSCRDSLAEYFD